MILTDGDKLMAELDGVVEEDIYYKVRDFIQELEGKVDELEDEVKDLERETDKTPDVYELMEYVEGLGDGEQEQILECLTIPTLKLPPTSDLMMGLLTTQLQELIHKHGVEECVALLSNPSYAW